MEQFSAEQAIWALNATSPAEFEGLIRYGYLEPNLTKDDGWSLLHAACQDNLETMVKLLLYYQAANNSQMPADGLAPIHLATINGNQQIMQHLLDANHDNAHLAKDDGWTPLHFACQQHNLASAELLVTYGGNLTQADINGLTAQDLLTNEELQQLLAATEYSYDEIY